MECRAWLRVASIRGCPLGNGGCLGEDGEPQEGMENPRGLWRTPGGDGEVLEKMDNPIRGWITPREDGEPQGRMEKPREG